jgi:hypothetical protein
MSLGARTKLAELNFGIINTKQVIDFESAEFEVE